jgi:hypothetical protein
MDRRARKAAISQGGNVLGLLLFHSLPCWRPGTNTQAYFGDLRLSARTILGIPSRLRNGTIATPSLRDKPLAQMAGHARSSPIRMQPLVRRPAAVIHGRRVHFLTRLPFLRACAHLEWDVDLTHRLVDSAWLRRSFEAIREQVGLQRK